MTEHDQQQRRLRQYRKAALPAAAAVAGSVRANLAGEDGDRVFQLLEGQLPDGVETHAAVSSVTGHMVKMAFLHGLAMGARQHLPAYWVRARWDDASELILVDVERQVEKLLAASDHPSNRAHTRPAAVPAAPSGWCSRLPRWLSRRLCTGL